MTALTIEERMETIEAQLMAQFGLTKEPDTDGNPKLRLKEAQSVDKDKIKDLLEQAVSDLFDVKVEYEDQISKCAFYFWKISQF